MGPPKMPDKQAVHGDQPGGARRSEPERGGPDLIAPASRDVAHAETSRDIVPDLRTLAHELRTPLSAIVTLAEVLRDAPPDLRGDARYAQYADDIRESALHALAVVASTLDAARAQDDVVGPLSLIDVDLARVCRQIASTMAPLAKIRGVDLQADVQGHSVAVRADLRCVRQILFNLTANALRFTPSGGTVVLTAQFVADHAPEIIVTDTGVGMGRGVPVSEDDQTGGFFGGSGIGLRLADDLANAIGAELIIDKAQDVGSRVVLRFDPNGTRGTA